MLAEAGIPSMLKNELAWWTPGARIVGLLPFAWPEVWVNEGDWKTASEILQDLDFDHQGVFPALRVWVTYNERLIATC
jgi:hypothetical protein